MWKRSILGRGLCAKAGRRELVRDGGKPGLKWKVRGGRRSEVSRGLAAGSGSDLVLRDPAPGRPLLRFMDLLCGCGQVT